MTMQGKSVTWTERLRRGDKTTEAILTVVFDHGDSPAEVLDEARIECEAAMRRKLNDEMLDEDSEVPF